jgi:hypothetical protein
MKGLGRPRVTHAPLTGLILKGVGRLRVTTRPSYMILKGLGRHL